MSIYNTSRAHSLGLGLKWGRSPSYLMESVFLRMRDVLSSAIFCSSLILMLLGICLVYFSKPFFISPNAPITTGIVVAFILHIRSISISRSLYFDSFSVTLTEVFFSVGIDISLDLVANSTKRRMLWIKTILNVKIWQVLDKNSHTASVVARVNNVRVPQKGTRLRSKNLLLEQTLPIMHLRISTPRATLKVALMRHHPQSL